MHFIHKPNISTVIRHKKPTDDEKEIKEISVVRVSTFLIGAIVSIIILLLDIYLF
jgi:hypothetical protein